MSSEVEIIDDNKQIIEISDDSSSEEDRKELWVLDDFAEEAAEENKYIVNDTIKESAFINDDSGGNSLLNELPMRDNNYDLTNIASVNKEHSHINISKDPQADSTFRKLRARIRKQIINRKGNASVGIRPSGKVPKFGKSATRCKDFNSSNKNIQIENNSTSIEQPTCSSNILTAPDSNERPFNSYDFSKINWLKPLRNLSSPPHLQIVIVDRGHPEWKITVDKWLMVEKLLLERLNKEMLINKDTSIGLFDGAKWQRGIKIIGCHNERAFEFITKFINSLDKLWIGAKLDTFPVSHIVRHIVRAYIPPPALKTDLVLSLLRLQNPSISSKDWRVTGERERSQQGGIDIWISISNEAFVQIKRLKGELKYGINRVWLKPQ